MEYESDMYLMFAQELNADLFMQHVYISFWMKVSSDYYSQL